MLQKYGMRYVMINCRLHNRRLGIERRRVCIPSSGGVVGSKEKVDGFLVLVSHSNYSTPFSPLFDEKTRKQYSSRSRKDREA